VIVSGLPHETKTHVEEMADIALCIQKVVLETRVPHMPTDYKLQMRVGLNTGLIATGVIGVHAPRYCLFGDTVVPCTLCAHFAQMNTASRMESTCEPMKIHLSTSTASALMAAGGWACELRGEVPVKGKGMMTTYWLLGRY
jgi:class 3 adenylate cyclase